MPKGPFTCGNPSCSEKFTVNGIIDGNYPYTCTKGHKTVVTIKNGRVESIVEVIRTKK